MNDTSLPVEVELVYEVMPCNAMRTAQEPGPTPHPCAYFRKWGTYHSYDYEMEGPPPQPGIIQKTKYLGRAALVPEILSGCRKAPILALGINPNLPGWWPRTRCSISPLFDDYKQYAHYFRYRAVSKLELPEEAYLDYGGGPHDTPLSAFELNVPMDAEGNRTIPVQLQPQKMYEAYQSLLDSLATEMGWAEHSLAVGEDLSYGNMVASPSAKWTTAPSHADPTLPPMTAIERDGIVNECFRERKYFLRQLFQSLPSLILVFSQSTANAFIDELGSRFTVGAPRRGEPLSSLMMRELRLQYGDLPDGSRIDARVIFAPHITGDSADFAEVRARVVQQLVEEAKAGRLHLNPQTKHLGRSRGSCVFCPMLEIGVCDYVDELIPLSTPSLRPPTPESHPSELQEEKRVQASLMAGKDQQPSSRLPTWDNTDDLSEPDELRMR